MTAAAISTRKLTKHYGSFPALVDLDLEVQPGEVFGFLGPNGAGKSTAIRTLMDEIRATSGSATMLGRDVHADAVALRRDIGYLPSDLSLYPKLTGRETIAFFAGMRGLRDLSFADQLASRLDADLGKRVGELSTGNRQKVGLIITFMHRPQLVIMDEPNAGLDPLVQHEFQQMMREVADDGRTVFLSSHTLSEVERVADRVGIIRGGQLVAVEDIETLRSRVIRDIELVLAAPARVQDFAALDGVRDVTVHDTRVRFAFDGDMGALLAGVLERHELRDISTHEADLESIFLAYYREEG